MTSLKHQYYILPKQVAHLSLIIGIFNGFFYGFKPSK